MRRAGRLVLWGATAAVAGALFLPWARFAWHTPEPLSQAAALGELASGLGRVTLELHRGGEAIALDTAALASLPRQVSGAALPFVLRRSEVRAALAVWELWQGVSTRAAQRSWLVYAIPAFLCALAGLATWGPRPLASAAALVAALAAAGLAARVAQLPLTHTYVTVSLEIGVWITIIGYGMAACAAGLLAMDQKGRA